MLDALKDPRLNLSELTLSTQQLDILGEVWVTATTNKANAEAGVEGVLAGYRSHIQAFAPFELARFMIAFARVYEYLFY